MFKCSEMCAGLGLIWQLNQVAVGFSRGNNRPAAIYKYKNHLKGNAAF